jgi:hypothetical protein
MIRLACILLVLSVAGAQDEPAKPAAPADKIASLTWLAGTWQGPIWGGTWTTQYTTPAGGMVLSTSKLLRGGKAAYFEFERFDVQGGDVVLNPYPKGSPAAKFKLVALEGKKATFENPKNDYPSRIVYHRVADDRLVITLSAPHHESDKRDVFDLKAVK